MSVSVSSAKGVPRIGVPEEIPLPWLFRTVLAIPGSPIWIGIAGVLLAMLFDLFWFDASGHWQGVYTEGVPYWTHPIASLNVAYELGLGFSLFALIQLVRGTDADVRRLALALPPESLEGVRREVLGISERALRTGTAIGLVVAIFDLWVGYRIGGVHHFPLLAQAWIIVREFVLTVFLVRVLAFGVIAAHRLSRVAGERVIVDLLDLAPLEPFTRHGLRLAFYWLLLGAIWVPVLFVDSTLDRSAFTAVAALIVAQAPLSAAAIAIPTKGARARVRETKRAALREVRAAIGRDRIAVIDPGNPGSADAAARLPALLAWEARIAAVSESLVDADVLRRMGLYLLIPVASWLGSALIEWLLGAVLE